MTLPQLTNSVEIVGTLKSVALEKLVSKNGSNKKYIKGTVSITSNADGKVHEHRISVFQMEKNKAGAVSKLYTGLETIINEYKAADVVGIENADRLRVTGELQSNEYYNKDGEFKGFNDIKGVFFNRLDETTDGPDKAMASVEVFVKGFAPVMIEETGEITHHTVSAYTIGYNESVVELRKVVVGNALVDAMVDLYPDNTTGRLTLKLNNYVDIIESTPQEAPVAMSHGFGSEETVEQSRTFNRYTNNLEITGGDLPFEEPKALTEEQIEEALRKLALSREELKQNAKAPAPATPATNTGFGGGAPTVPTTPTLPKAPVAPTVPGAVETSEDDIPDF